jgi:Nif-specific regulatory protein
MNGFLLPLEAMRKVHRLAAGGAGARDDSDGEREGPDRRSVLLALLDLVRTEVDLDSLLRRVVDLVARAMAADRATLFMVDTQTGELVSRAAHLPELPEIRLQKGQGIVGHVAQTHKPVNIPHADDHPRFAAGIDKLTGYKTVTVLAVPVLGRARASESDGTDGAEAADGSARELLGVIEVLNKKHGIFNDADRELLADLADEVATVLTVTTLPQRVTGQAPERYHRIIGTSPLMQRVYDIIARAAATTATVLVRGESGTGKELAARAIHYNSQRARGPFIKIDCTSIPDGLMESELFGHERGAFTGAEQRVLGKAELASGGTLFLDEIGDLKPSLQGKLLRLLQDREFERVGGRKTIAVDVRIVAATNRDLGALALSGHFRADLYYRLKVIELELPSLRARGSDDIERLALHFVELYAHRHKKPVRGLHREALARLRAHVWPGNIRELEHCIESAVALCAGEQITAADLPLPMPLGLPPPAFPPSATSARSSRSTVPPASARSLRPASASSTGSTSSELSGEFSGELAVPATPLLPGGGLHLPDGLTLEEVEQRYLAHTIARYGGNRSEAARALGIGRNTLLRKLRDTPSEN